MSLKFNIDKFDGTGDFGIWRRKVKALLSQQKILKAIEGPNKLPDALTDEQKDDMLEMALWTIILNLYDNVLRKVNDESTAFDVWKKLESLYLTKSLTNKIYLKECLFSFKMDPSKCLGQNLDEFKRMTIELANVGEKRKLSDENEVIILLNSLPDSFKDVKAAIKYGRSSFSLEECISALKSKNLELKIEKKDLGKQHRLSFSIAQHTTKEVLEYIHSDLWGPAKVERSQNQLEINESLVDYELVRDRVRRIVKPNSMSMQMLSILHCALAKNWKILNQGLIKKLLAL
ncbi:hypothetical protein EZV62_015017 [Acer yangbiense]|uniref:Reverse transcriptase Ty1/copia-type domain-containing protein n=1 Tax=Acer yangbiense TaxID=1000413 RepID=A0A5C7HUI3_9ROSI|nr:hypothetical protein EZV62_015017 [Acer yangbiense]